MFAVVLFIPLFQLPGMADPVQAPRLLVLGIILTLSLVLVFNVDRFKGLRSDFLRSGIILSFLAYILFTVISIIFAVNSLEGLFDLGRTLLSFLVLVLFSYLLIRDPESLNRLVRMFVIMAILLSFTGLVQYVLHVSGRMGEGMYARLYLVKGLSGHKVAFSIMLFLTMPLVIYGIYAFKRTWKILSVAAFLISFTLIIITQTRAVWIGCAAALLTVTLYTAIFRIRKGKAISGSGAKWFLYASAAVIVAGAAYFAASPGFRKVVAYQVQGMADAENVSNLPRISILGSTLEMIGDHPITGVGAGNWKIAVPPYQYDYVYYMTDHRHPEVRFQNWIRPHNDPLWVLSEKGPGGLMAYLAGFLFLFLLGHRIIMHAASESKAVLAALVTGVLVGYVVLSAFSFPLERMDNQVYLMVLMAVLISLEYGSRKSGARMTPVAVRSMGLFAISLSAVTAIYAGYMIKAEHDLGRLVHDGNGKEDLSITMDAILSDAALVTLDPFANPLEYYVGVQEMKNGNPAGAMKHFKEACRAHPHNVNLLLAMMKACVRTGDLAASKHYGAELLEIFPFHQEGLMTLAMVHFMERNYDRSLQTLLAVKQGGNTVEQAIRKTLSRIDGQATN